MKKIPLRICSGLLVLVCLISLVFAGLNLRGALDCKAYWEEAGAQADESFGLLEDGISRLKENENAYLEGVDAYEDGLEDYEAGEDALADGAKKLSAGEAAYADGAARLEAGQNEYNAGAAKLEEGKRQYQEGLAQLEAAKAQLEEGKAQLAQGEAELEAGKARLAAGEAELEAHRQEYEEGKAQIAAAEPLYQAALAGKAEIDNLIAERDRYAAMGPLFQDKVTELNIAIAMAQAAYQADFGGTSLDGLIAQIEEGKAKLAAYEAGMAEVEAGRQEVAAGEAKLEEGRAKVAEGEAQIAEGEAKLAEAKAKLDAGEAELAAARQRLNDGQAQLDAGAADLAKGYKDYAAGEDALKEGAAALADGLARLGEYEGGEQQVADGLNLVIGTDTYYDRAGRPLVRSIADRLGADFSYWKLDQDGNYVFLNGERHLDLDKAAQVVRAGRDFLADTSDVVTQELTGRIISLVAIAVACIAGLVAGILGLVGLRLGAMIPAILSAAAGLAASALILVDGMENPMSVISRTGNTVGVFVWACVVSLLSLTVIVVAALTKTGAPAVAAPAAPVLAGED